MTIPIEWSDSYKINHAEIDAQHQELFVRVSKFLQTTDKANLTTGAMSFFKYTREHFALEEQLMRQLDYPDIDLHNTEHNALITKLNANSRSIAIDTLDAAGLATFLTNWLLNHFAATDARFAKFVTLKGISNPRMRSTAFDSCNTR